MITLSHDPDAGTLYWYFAEIEEGAVQFEGESDAALLLDAEGLIIGAQLELDESVRAQDLALALEQPGVSYDADAFLLTVMLFDEEPAEEQPLDEPAILDFNAAERLLGFELLPAQTFGLATRLERLAERLVVPEVVEEPQPDRSEEVIAAWVARQEGTDRLLDAAELTPDEEQLDEDQGASEFVADAEPALATSADSDSEPAGALATLADPPPAAPSSAVEPPPPLAEAELAEETVAEDGVAGVLPAEELAEETVAEDGVAGVEVAPVDGDVLAPEAPGTPAELLGVEAVLPASGELAPPDAAEAPDGQPQLRSGFVAIVGKPNVGKSTLLNSLLGQKVAIVSPKPQTTRTPMRGILNRPDAQVIFIDTPGIHDPRSKLGTYMVDLARQAIPDADVVCFMVDITNPPARLDRKIAGIVRRARAPRLLVLNKVDATNKQTRDYLQDYRDLGEWDLEVAVSARTGDGLPALLDEIIRRLPPGPRLYPEDQVSDQSERELAAELVREKVLRFTEQEVPHAVAVEVEEWENREALTYIRMTIYTEKDSQKSILIGAGGTMLKRIGTAARADIERVVGRPVFLDVWVKTRANWRDDPAALHWLGYSGRDKR